MAAPQQTIWPLTVSPGIKRDGTSFEGNFWTGGQWVRFQRALPRSIGGYQQTASGFAGPSRGMEQYSINGTNRVHSGSSNKLELAIVAPSGATSGTIDRTPSGFVTSPNNKWQFEIMANAAAGSTNSAIIAHAAQNLAQIDSDEAGIIYYGDVNGDAALVDTGATPVSGGILVLHPYLVTFGSYGNVAWSDANQPTVWTGGDSGFARPTESKIVEGLVVRGGPGYAPAGLLWSLNSLIRMSFIGGAAIFQFDTVSDQITILSSSAVVEYDSIYYWPGTDRFLLYNGIVREIPNALNLNWFYDNLNRSQAQKVWGTKVPHFGEIWWFYPRGNATECTDVIIYNVRENTWYDGGSAPGCLRSAGLFPEVSPYPLWLKNTPDPGGTYSLWRHEIGTDEVYGNVSNAILSRIETCDISWCASGPSQDWVGINRNVVLDCFELDFVQNMPMTLTVKGKAYAQGSPDVGDRYPFGPGTSNTTRVQPTGKGERRQMSLVLESNISGGSWQMGNPILTLSFGSEMPTPLTETGS